MAGEKLRPCVPVAVPLSSEPGFGVCLVGPWLGSQQPLLDNWFVLSEATEDSSP